MADEVPASSWGGGHESGEQSPRSNAREHDMFLPMANISRIMKNAVPRDGKTTKEAKEFVQECVSEFICFITCEAIEISQEAKRKTILGEDLLRGMAILGFEDYIDLLRFCLKKYRELEGDGKGSAKGAESSGMGDAGGLQIGNLYGSSMQGDMKMLQHDSFTEGMICMDTQGFGKGVESSGMIDAGGLQFGNLAGSSMQGDMKMLQQDSFTVGMIYMDTQGFGKGAESSGMIDAGGLQIGNLAGSSMQGDMNLLQQDFFTEGMIYMDTQVNVTEQE